MSARPLPKTTPEIAWGEEMLDRLASGETSHVAIGPYQADETQLAAITTTGSLAAFTGPRCPDYAGQAVSTNVSAQVNTARLSNAPALMLEALCSAIGPLAER